MRTNINAPMALLAAFFMYSCSQPAPSAQTQASAPANQAPKWGMVIHTGAGNFTLAGIAERKDAMQAAMNEALMAGYRVLAGGGASLDAVQATIVILEDSPLFNAGKGAVFTHEGTNELDAAIMDGATMKAGAVAGLKRIKNPILLARLVMEKSPHVLMAGAGAEAFAKQEGVDFVDQKYFYTDRAWKTLQDELAAEKKKAAQTEDHHGTVGAVALDQHGNLAAGTSTGGLTNKRFGRIGDSPIIGAGTYANNQSCAISSTGIGEFWIRYTVAHDICARVQYTHVSIQAAADAVVQGELKPVGGEGGVIGLDAHGNVMMSFNTTGMGRGYVGEDGKPAIMFTEHDGQ
ncbi:MAG TPA: isoaspartyl peptidase/L-asparaginase [Vicinamibacterales bacterium]|nr:isoaspartyl peptidase/L-asparaginase [Vicinamibacterales bacterium]